MRIKPARAAPTMIGIKMLVSSNEHSWAADKERVSQQGGTMIFWFTTQPERQVWSSSHHLLPPWKSAWFPQLHYNTTFSALHFKAVIQHCGLWGDHMSHGCFRADQENRLPFQEVGFKVPQAENTQTRCHLFFLRCFTCDTLVSSLQMLLRRSLIKTKCEQQLLPLV